MLHVAHSFQFNTIRSLALQSAPLRIIRAAVPLAILIIAIIAIGTPAVATPRYRPRRWPLAVSQTARRLRTRTHARIVNAAVQVVDARVVAVAAAPVARLPRSARAAPARLACTMRSGAHAVGCWPLDADGVALVLMQTIGALTSIVHHPAVVPTSAVQGVRTSGASALAIVEGIHVDTARLIRLAVPAHSRAV